MAQSPPFLDYPQSELVFGLVGAVGTDLERFKQGLLDLLRHYGYTGYGIRLSDFIPESVKFKSRCQVEYKRISTMMTAGTKLCSDGEDDVPCCGGGQYWPGEADRRDHVLGFDSNDAARNDMLLQIMERIPKVQRGKKQPARSLSRARLLERARKLFAGTAILDITEFGRAVHGEMEAILSCVRSGSCPQNGTLYCTTFPCHNCAKHIVAAGIARVVYVEPYPRSRARELHSDSIAFGGEQSGKVVFEPFTGKGPRRYFDLFSMKLGAGYDLVRKKGGLKLDWTRGGREDGKRPESSSGEGANGPRVPMLPTSYIQRETLAAVRIEALMRKVKGKRDKQNTSGARHTKTRTKKGK